MGQEGWAPVPKTVSGQATYDDKGSTEFAPPDTQISVICNDTASFSSAISGNIGSFSINIGDTTGTCAFDKMSLLGDYGETVKYMCWTNDTPNDCPFVVTSDLTYDVLT